MLILFPGAGAKAQGADTARPAFRLDADLSRFFGAESLTYVELSYGLSEAALTYAHDSGGFRGAVDMDLELRAGGKTVASRRWIVSRTIPESLAHLSAKNILSIETISLPAGEYTAVLSCRDRIDSTRRDSVVIPVRAVVGDTATIALSDIELCSRITPSADRSSLFYKNTLEVIPNPSRVYGEGLSVLQFYAEVYNLKSSGEGGVVIRAAIMEPGGREVASQSRPKAGVNNSSVEHGSMNITSLPGGTYLFRITVEDTVSAPARVLASSEKKFFVFRPGPVPARENGARTDAPDDFSVMPEASISEEFREIVYLATPAERSQMEGMNDPGAMRNFLRTFWAGRETDGTPGSNGARARYLGRIARANVAYAERNRKGWLTDRGRVFILYGPPDDVERHPNESEAHPYEIWKYNALQGGVEFVFVDELGFGRYRQVHSSHRDELRNDNWFNEEAKIR
jgi:GWxTD domain-containing protein